MSQFTQVHKKHLQPDEPSSNSFNIFLKTKRTGSRSPRSVCSKFQAAEAANLKKNFFPFPDGCQGQIARAGLVHMPHSEDGGFQDFLTN